MIPSGPELQPPWPDSLNKALHSTPAPVGIILLEHWISILGTHSPTQKVLEGLWSWPIDLCVCYVATELLFLYTVGIHNCRPTGDIQ